ncbi:MAG TPA: hypothetical protein VKA49_22335 [Flavitalea sp.]|nr:hypothetical protein [Flavitalea sp.]
MKKSFLFLVITLLTLNSCRKQNASLTNEQTLAESPAQLSTSALAAQPYNVQNYVSLDGEVVMNPCTNELIELAGICHVFGHGVYDLKTNTLKDEFHINLQGVKGVGLTTGNSYQVQDNISARTIISHDGCVLTFSLSETFRIIAPDANNNFNLIMKLTYTLDLCTLEYTVKRDEFSTECR